MIRVLFFALLVLALGIGFAWLADRPGDIILTLGQTRYEVTLMVAASIVVGLTAAIMLAWWILKAIWNSPMAMRRYFRARKRDRGYQSISTGMIAAGAGDTLAARRMTKQASGLLNADHEPLLKLLDAQTALLEGNHDAARAKFETMLDDPETRVLALRGLYLEAERLGDREAARHYAERAFELNAGLGWAGNASLQMKTLGRDWDGALAMLDKQRTARQVEKGEASRKRAVLLTAKAMELLDKDATAARNLATEANKLAPDLVPASVTAAEAMFRLNDLRKGASMLEKAWKLQPHPDIAAAYVGARAGDSVLDRLKRARRLESMRNNNPDALMAIARAALAAGEFGEARTAIESVTRIDPREGAWLLLADIEEAETGDQGRVRAWLAKAVRAPRDAAWTADGFVSDRWLPVSPVTGEVDAFQWKVPVEQIAPVIEAGRDGPDRAGDEALAAIPIMPPRELARSKTVKAAGTAPVFAVDTPPRKDAEDETQAKAGEDSVEVVDAEVVSEPASAGEGAGNAVEPDTGKPAAQPDTANAAEQATLVPDDPGVDPDAPVEKPKRFRLF